MPEPAPVTSTILPLKSSAMTILYMALGSAGMISTTICERVVLGTTPSTVSQDLSGKALAEQLRRRLCDQFALMACAGQVDLAWLTRPVAGSDGGCAIRRSADD